MERYVAVWDDQAKTPLNGSVVLSKERFACDWKSTDGSVVCYSTTSQDGKFYAGNVLEPEQRAVGTFTSPRHHSEYRVEFRRHRRTKNEPWIRMEYLRWASETEVEGEGELCDILLIPVQKPEPPKRKKATDRARNSNRKK